MSDLTAVNLFAGIEGIGLALHHAGIQVKAAVEIDPAARGVIADHFPDTALFNDVTEVTADDLRAAGFDPQRGIATAGFPCQDLSVAGRRKGMGEGTRSGLWWHVIRLLAGLRPRWFLGENVPGLLSATCPCPGDGSCGTACPLDRDLHSVSGGICEGGCIPTHGGAMGAVLGSLAELGYGFAYRVLDSQYFGVPQRRPRIFVVGHPGDWAAPVQVLLEPEGGGGNPASRREAGADLAGPLMAGSDGRGWRIGADEAAASQLIPFAVHENQRGEITTNDITGALNSGGGKPGQGYPAVVTHALTAEGADASEDGTGCGTPLVPMAFNWQTGGDMRLGYDEKPTALQREQVTAVQTDTAVRRLTPLECERLQGFPDQWTATSNGKPQSDSARYRQLGNAVAVPVVEWIAHRIASADREAVAS